MKIPIDVRNLLLYYIIDQTSRASIPDSFVTIDFCFSQIRILDLLHNQKWSSNGLEGLVKTDEDNIQFIYDDNGSKTFFRKE